MTAPRPSCRDDRGGVLLWLLILLLLGLMLVVLYVARGPLLRFVGEEWIVDDPPQKVQAIVVLGGDTVFGDRVRRAADLYRSGWAPRIVLSGKSYRAYFNEVELMKSELTNLGVPSDHVIVAPHSGTSLLEEARALAPVLAHQHLRRIILVTSNYQTRRARRIFRTLYRDQGLEVFLSAAPDPDFDAARWWQQPRGRILLLEEVIRFWNDWWEARQGTRPSLAWFTWPADLGYSLSPVVGEGGVD